jgi:inosine/xanthosine triphosphatase
MKIIVVASQNPAKIRATLGGFTRMFPNETFRIEPVSVPSGVKVQPSSDYETLTGAETRATNASKQSPEADYWIGIEGGVEDHNGEISAYAWIVILSKELAGRSRTGTFFLPEEVASLIRGGKELGEADDIVFHEINSKQKNGAVGLLTTNVIDRIKLYEHAVILALIPFKNPEMYKKHP